MRAFLVSRFLSESSSAAISHGAMSQFTQSCTDQEIFQPGFDFISNNPYNDTVVCKTGFLKMFTTNFSAQPRHDKAAFPLYRLEPNTRQDQQGSIASLICKALHEINHVHSTVYSIMLSGIGCQKITWTRLIEDLCSSIRLITLPLPN